MTDVTAVTEFDNQFRSSELTIGDGLRVVVVAIAPETPLGEWSVHLNVNSQTSRLQLGLVHLSRDELAGLRDRCTQVLNVIDAQRCCDAPGPGGICPTCPESDPTPLEPQA